MPVQWMEEVLARFEQDYAENPELWEAVVDQPPGLWVKEAEGLLGMHGSHDDEEWAKVRGLALSLAEAESR